MLNNKYNLSQNYIFIYYKTKETNNIMYQNQINAINWCKRYNHDMHNRYKNYFNTLLL